MNPRRGVATQDHFKPTRRPNVPQLHHQPRRWLGWTSLLAAAALVAACGGDDGEPDTALPDFGPNVLIVDPSMRVEDINTKLQALAARSDGFDGSRSAVYFMPGTYGSEAGRFDPATATGHIDSPVGFMMTVQGLGAAPGDVTINGNLRVGAFQVDALGTFWRSLANLTIVPIQADEPAFTLRWNTSQASSLRRVHVAGHLDLSGGISFGSYMANSQVEGELRYGSGWEADRNPPVTGGVEQGPAQYLIRDGAVGSVVGRQVHMVLSGVAGAPAGAFAPGDKTTQATTAVSRDAPFVYVEGQRFKVFVPAVARNTSGVHWGTAAGDGRSLPISDFFIAKPEHTAATLNAALAQGRHLLLTPGVYRVEQPIRVTRANTVVLGMGLATLTPTTGTAAIAVDDVPGVVLASLMVDANTPRSELLVQVGPDGAQAGDATNPTSLIDVYVRIGGSFAGSVGTAVVVNQGHVVIDHTWIWRADHGNDGTTGWSVNTADHALVVNGSDVSAVALFAEHFQKTQVVWNGERGRTVFMQCEPPLRPALAGGMDERQRKRLPLLPGRRRPDHARGRRADQLGAVLRHVWPAPQPGLCAQRHQGACRGGRALHQHDGGPDLRSRRLRERLQRSRRPGRPHRPGIVRRRSRLHPPGAQLSLVTLCSPRLRPRLSVRPFA